MQIYRRKTSLPTCGNLFDIILPIEGSWRVPFLLAWGLLLCFYCLSFCLCLFCCWSPPCVPPIHSSTTNCLEGSGFGCLWGFLFGWFCFVGWFCFFFLLVGWVLFCFVFLFSLSKWKTYLTTQQGIHVWKMFKAHSNKINFYWMQY